MKELRAVVPGPPVAQGRPRFTGRRAVDPARSRAWKERASALFFVAVARAGLPRPAFRGAVELQVLAVWPCQETRARRSSANERTPRACVPDADNVAKATMDAGKGILWLDDGQVARLVVDKVYGAPGEEPRVEVWVREFSA